jgi:hypothetical protein
MQWVAVTGLLVTIGCSTFDSGSLKKLTQLGRKPKVIESEYGQPAKMAVTWSDTVYTVAGLPPTRGFGGRIYFYNDSGKCVAVEGQLVVYAYDDTSADNVARSPARKYVFNPEQFANHYSPSDLGASYSVWLPWDAVEGERITLSLLPVFRSTSGQIVMGQQSVNVLPGKEPTSPPLQGNRLFGQRPGPAQPLTDTAFPRSPTVQQVQYQQPLDAAATPYPSPADQPSDAALKSTTFTLTPSLSRRVSQPDSSTPPKYLPGTASAASASSTPASAPTSQLQTPMAKMVPTTQPMNQPPTRFVRPRHQVPRGPAAQPNVQPAPMQHFPGAQPFPPPNPPRFQQPPVHEQSW